MQSASSSPVVQNEPLRKIASSPSVIHYELPNEEGMTLQQLATTIGLNYHRLVATKNKMSLEAFLEYLHHKSGIVWRYDATVGRYGKYFQVELVK